jgi:hypothetical protein
MPAGQSAFRVDAGFPVKEGSISFLKKRNKKLLFYAVVAWVLTHGHTPPCDGAR